MDNRMKRSDISTLPVLQACRDSYNTDKSAGEILVERFNAPEKLVASAMERDYKNGLIEYGTGIFCSWTTAKGNNCYNNNKITIDTTKDWKTQKAVTTQKTFNLRWVRNTNVFSTKFHKLKLQQMHQGSDGSQSWHDVDIVDVEVENDS